MEIYTIRTQNLKRKWKLIPTEWKNWWKSLATARRIWWSSCSYAETKEKHFFSTVFELHTGEAFWHSIHSASACVAATYYTVVVLLIRITPQCRHLHDALMVSHRSVVCLYYWILAHYLKLWWRTTNWTNQMKWKSICVEFKSNFISKREIFLHLVGIIGRLCRWWILVFIE